MRLCVEPTLGGAGVSIIGACLRDPLGAVDASMGAGGGFFKMLGGGARFPASMFVFTVGFWEVGGELLLAQVLVLTKV